MNILFCRIHENTPKQGRGNKAEPRLKWRTSQYFNQLKKITGLRSAQGLSNFINNNLLDDYPDDAISRKSIDNYCKGKRVFSDKVLRADIQIIIEEKFGDKAQDLNEIWNSPLIYSSSTKYNIKRPDQSISKEIKIYYWIRELIDFSLIYLNQAKLRLKPKRNLRIKNEAERAILQIIYEIEEIKPQFIINALNAFLADQILWEAEQSSITLKEQEKEEFKEMILNCVNISNNDEYMHKFFEPSDMLAGFSVWGDGKI